MEFWEDYETLRIETPEGLDLYLPLAGFGPRFLAFLIDMVGVTILQVVIIFAAIFILVASQFGSTAGPDDFSWVMVLVMIVTVLIMLLAPVLYFMLFESLWNGQSPGKRVTGIRVIRRGGFAIGRREIFTRNILRMIDYLPSNWVVGLISFFATQNQQRVGDIVADTVVVREFAGRRPISSPMTFDRAASDMRQPAGTIPPQVTYVISSYLQRAHELEPEMRERLSLRCIEALGYSGNHLSLSQREGYLASIVQNTWAVAQ